MRKRDSVANEMTDGITILERNWDKLSLLFDVLNRDNASLIYFTLQMFGPLRPKNIEIYTKIATGRMYNELSKLLETGLITKEQILVDDKEKTHYRPTSYTILHEFLESKIDLGSLLDPKYRKYYEIYTRYVMRYPVLFQNFQAKVAGNLFHKHIETNDHSKGDFTNYQELLRLSPDNYQILRSRIKLLIRDLNLNTEEEDNDVHLVALSISLLMYDNQE